ncbi:MULTISPECIES: DUF5610 domain-containing protein [Pseudomonadaceae]|uniref:DUF5610 domain-containing protein n=1 Tax=Pseudomonadaceae TaxID=135621 RepID=UPI0005CA5376|nr:MULTISPECIES: DUF5610 domain-containing protein [Pseudomonas]KIV62696.1 hypothetical protein SZ55_4589 [Pseudomonas sp. FeS53a]MBO2929913.1 DUF5610 domain-containing protein [Pseudomonas otitidis]MDG9781630.1 DUF5610 domain-containing protein [Pseudomonas otitidis]
MNSLDSLASATSRPNYLTRSDSANRNATNAQNVLANRVAQRLGVDPATLAGKTQDDYTPDKVAGRILDFVGGRIQAEAANGADPEKLQKMLDQARQGVEKGFAEAKKILQGMGVLGGKIASDIEDTFQRVQDGLARIGSTYGLGNAPAGDTSSVSRTAVSASTSTLVARSSTFDMEVTTREGDKLKISIAQASANWSSTSASASSTRTSGNGGTSTSTSAQVSASSGSLQIGGWSVQIEGNLNDDEKAALTDLLGQVQDISSKFYSGDLSGAFDRALALNMNGDQLASMSLNLSQTTYAQATSTYGAVSEEGGQPASAVNTSLRDYARGLLDAMKSAAAFSDDAKGTLQQLLDGGFSLNQNLSEGQLEKAKSLNSRLLEGLAPLLQGTASTPAEKGAVDASAPKAS